MIFQDSLFFRQAGSILTTCFAIQLTLSPVCSRAAINGSDDFSDNIKDSQKWGGDRVTGAGLLTETSQRLQYTSSGQSFTQTASRPWSLNRASCDTNWEVILDVANNTILTTTGTYVSMGIEIYPSSSFTRSVYAGLYASTASGLPTQRGFESGMINGSNESGYTTDNTATTAGSIRVIYSATSRVVSLSIDPNGATGGYQWTQLSTYGINGSGTNTADASWGMAETDEFLVYIYGYSQGVAVPAGTLHADNFTASTGSSMITTAPTSITETGAVVQARAYPAGLETVVSFEYSLSQDFSNPITTSAQTVSATASSTSVSQSINGLSPAQTYYVRARASNAGGTTLGQSITFATPPYTLALQATTGTLTRTPAQVNYAAGTLITLTATPPTGAVFLNWSGSATGQQNPLTLTMDGNKSVTANFSVGLADATELKGTPLTTGGNSGWFGQSVIHHDGVDAGQSGAIGNSQQSWFQTTVTGPGEITFWWKVSSESTDYLEFLVDNIRQPNRIGGIVNWVKRSYTIEAGTHTLRWQYSKDASFAEGSDAGWVDEIIWSPQLTTFSNWKALHFTEPERFNPAFSGASSDPDHDGLTNLMEFALGGLPKDSSSAPRPVGGKVTIDGLTYATLETGKAENITDLTYQVKVSTDLQNWQGGPQHTILLEETSSLLRVRDATPLQLGSSRFLRLEVTSGE